MAPRSPGSFPTPDLTRRDPLPATKSEDLLRKIDPTRLPRHIAIIMDGNGRWAKKKGLPRIFGHRAGTQSVREIVEACGELGIEVLTLYAFSTENWSRPAAEVSGLMELLCATIRREADHLDKNRVCLRTIGRLDGLPKKVQNELARTVRRLEGHRGLVLNLALNYGGRQEIVDAVNRLLKSGAAQIDESAFREALDTRGLPDPDLLIRTSGEQRISNFLIYQSAYAEFYTTPTLWPDFRRKNLHEAVLEYQRRERRFGSA